MEVQNRCKMAKLHLTDLSIRKLPLSPGTTYYWDSYTRGFGLRVSKTAKTFVVLTGSGRRETIGRYPDLKLAEARAEASRILAERTLGNLRPTRRAFDDARNEFLKECERKNRALTVRDYRRLLARHYPYKREALADITPDDIRRRLMALAETPSERIHAFTAGRAFFRWCVRQRYIDRSPMEHMQLPSKPNARDRILSDDELKAVYTAALKTPYPFGPIVQLLILTGQRRGEIGALRWEYVEDDTITLPASATKNRRQHTFPIGTMATSVIQGLPRLSKEYLFPAARAHVKGKPTTSFNGWPKAKVDLDERCDIQGWTLHDLRRTFSSNMAALGVAPHVTEKLLNHVSGTVSGVAAVYNRYRYLPEMREAIDAWETRLQSLIGRTYTRLAHR